MEKLNFYADNIGGVAKIMLISPDSVSRVIQNVVTGKNFLILRNRDNIIEILADDEFEFREVVSETDDGITYETDLKGFIVKIDKNNTYILDRLVQERWLMVHQDGNGEIWLSGSKEFPLTFSYSRTSGKNASDRNLASFNVQGIQSEPSVRIEDTFI